MGSTRNGPVILQVLPEVSKSSIRAKRWHLILLGHYSVHINASLPSQCTISILNHLDLLLCIDSHMILVNIFKKVWSISLPPIPFAYRTAYCKFLVTYSPIGMFIRLLRWPKLHVLLVDMLAQMKMDFATKQNQNKITWVDFKFFTNGVVNFTPFFLIGISLCLEYFHFV